MARFSRHRSEVELEQHLKKLELARRSLISPNGEINIKDMPRVADLFKEMGDTHTRYLTVVEGNFERSLQNLCFACISAALALLTRDLFFESKVSEFSSELQAFSSHLDSRLGRLEQTIGQIPVATNRRLDSLEKKVSTPVLTPEIIQDARDVGHEEYGQMRTTNTDKYYLWGVVVPSVLSGVLSGIVVGGAISSR
jgi:hypothetical protein